MAMGSLADSAWSTVKVPLNADDNQGIEVHEAVSSFFSDAENSLLGMCVIRAQESGVFIYISCAKLNIAVQSCLLQGHNCVCLCVVPVLLYNYVL